MAMKNPPRPGLSVKLDCLEPLGLTVTEGTKVLGVSRKTLSDLVNGHAGISPEMAIRLSKAFGSRPEVWAGIQLDYDIVQAMKRADTIQVQRVPQPIPVPGWSTRKQSQATICRCCLSARAEERCRPR